MENESFEDEIIDNYGIEIVEYQLYTKVEEVNTLSFFSNRVVSHKPYVKIYVTKEKHDELYNEKINLRNKLDLVIESLVKSFTQKKNMEIEILGFYKYRDLHGDNIENNGYFIEITFIEVEEHDM